MAFAHFLKWNSFLTPWNWLSTIKHNHFHLIFPKKIQVDWYIFPMWRKKIDIFQSNAVFNRFPFKVTFKWSLNWNAVFNACVLNRMALIVPSHGLETTRIQIKPFRKFDIKEAFIYFRSGGFATTFWCKQKINPNICKFAIVLNFQQRRSTFRCSVHM